MTTPASATPHVQIVPSRCEWASESEPDILDLECVRHSLGQPELADGLYTYSQVHNIIRDDTARCDSGNVYLPVNLQFPHVGPRLTFAESVAVTLSTSSSMVR